MVTWRRASTTKHPFCLTSICSTGLRSGGFSARLAFYLSQHMKLGISTRGILSLQLAPLQLGFVYVLIAAPIAWALTRYGWGIKDRRAHDLKTLKCFN